MLLLLHIVRMLAIIDNALLLLLLSCIVVVCCMLAIVESVVVICVQDVLHQVAELHCLWVEAQRDFVGMSRTWGGGVCERSAE